MPYPPVIPPNTRTNTTLQVNDHPADHNQISDALTEIVNRIAALEQLLVPVGGIYLWPGDTAPNKTLFCEGQAVSRTQYAAVFTLYGVRFGPGDGSTTFNLPNFKGRSPVGFDAASTYANIWTPTIGTKDLIVVTHGHTVAQHQHVTPDHLHGAGSLYMDDQGTHQHGPGTQGVFLTGTINPSGVVGQGGAQLAQVVFDNFTGFAGLHRHNMGGMTGASDRPLTTSLGGNNTDNAGSSGTDKNIPPSQAMRFVMRME